MRLRRLLNQSAVLLGLPSFRTQAAATAALKTLIVRNGQFRLIAQKLLWRITNLCFQYASRPKKFFRNYLKSSMYRHEKIGCGERI